MKDGKNETPQADMKMPLEAVAVIMNGAVTELSEFIRIDDAGRPADVPVGLWAARQIVDGKAVRVYDKDTADRPAGAKYWDVTLESLRAGVQKYMTAGMMFLLDGDTLDAEALEPGDSVPIIALGMFGTPAEVEGGC